MLVARLWRQAHWRTSRSSFLFEARSFRKAGGLFFLIMLLGGGWIMRRVIAIAVAGYSVAGCSSFSLDSFKPTPPTVQIQLESTPPGADAVTSLGPACKTPCAVAVPAPDSGFSVTYTLNK